MPYRKQTCKVQMEKNRRLLFLKWQPLQGVWFVPIDALSSERLKACFLKLGFKSHNGFPRRPRVHFEDRFAFKRRARLAGFQVRYCRMPTLKDYKRLARLGHAPPTPFISRKKRPRNANRTSLAHFFPAHSER